jgi:hypothetical protein
MAIFEKFLIDFIVHFIVQTIERNKGSKDKIFASPSKRNSG